MGFVNAARGVGRSATIERPSWTRAGRLRHSLGVGLLGAAAHAPPARVQPRGVGRARSWSRRRRTTCDYALGLDETWVVGLFLETLRDPDDMRPGWSRRGGRARHPRGGADGRRLPDRTGHGDRPSAHIAGDDAAWEALFAAYGVHRAQPRRARPTPSSCSPSGGGSAPRTAAPRPCTTPAASGPLDGRRGRRRGGAVRGAGRHRQDPAGSPGSSTRLEATNPLDVWGTGAETEALFTDVHGRTRRRRRVSASSRCRLDLVEEYDGDEASRSPWSRCWHAPTSQSSCSANVAAAVDQEQASRLRGRRRPCARGHGIGARALRHLFDHAVPVARRPPVVANAARRAVARSNRSRPPGWRSSRELLRDYDVDRDARFRVDRRRGTRRRGELGFPVALQTDAAGIEHRSDVDGVLVELVDVGPVRRTPTSRPARPPWWCSGSSRVRSVALGLVRDPLLGPLVVVAIGGTLVEVLAQRQVALPPLSLSTAAAVLDGLPALPALLRGVRGQPNVDRAAVERAVVAVGQLALELGTRSRHSTSTR